MARSRPVGASLTFPSSTDELVPHSSIEAVIHAILSEEHIGNKEGLNREEICVKFHSEWIFTLNMLCQVPSELLKKLSLPLFLQCRIARLQSESVTSRDFHPLSNPSLPQSTSSRTSHLHGNPLQQQQKITPPHSHPHPHHPAHSNSSPAVGMAGYQRPPSREQSPRNSLSFSTPQAIPRPQDGLVPPAAEGAVEAPFSFKRTPLLPSPEAISTSKPSSRPSSPIQSRKNSTASSSSSSSAKPALTKTPRRISHSFLIPTADKVLIFQSYDVLNTKENREEFSRLFQQRLFSLYPHARHLFADSDTYVQGKVIMRMVDWFVKTLRKGETEETATHLARLAGRHAMYGVKSEGYAFFAQAIAETLKMVLATHQLPANTFDAWSRSFVKVGESMGNAAVLVKKYSGLVLKESSVSGKWRERTLAVTGDHFRVYRDVAMTGLKATYPMKGVTGLSFPSQSEKWCFCVHSSNPSFEVKFRALSDLEFAAWVKEFTWRIQAIHRVAQFVLSDTHSDSASEGEVGLVSASVSETETDTEKDNVREREKEMDREGTKEGEGGDDGEKGAGNRIPEDIMVLTKSTNALVKKTRRRRKILAETTLAKGSGLSLKQLELLKESWNSLRLSEEKIAALSSGFFPPFFLLAPALKGYFEKFSESERSRHLSRALGFIVECALMASSPPSAIECRYAGSHCIYGIDSRDFGFFKEVMLDALRPVLGSSTSTVRPLWEIAIQRSISRFLSVAAKLNEEPPVFNALIRSKNNSLGHIASKTWVSYRIVVQLDSISLFKTEKNKFKSSLMFVDVSKLSEGKVEGKKSDIITVVVGNFTHSFYFKDPSESHMFFDELTWRREANIRKASADRAPLLTARRKKSVGAAEFSKQKSALIMG